MLDILIYIAGITIVLFLICIFITVIIVGLIKLVASIFKAIARALENYIGKDSDLPN